MAFGRTFQTAIGSRSTRVAAGLALSLYLCLPAGAQREVHLSAMATAPGIVGGEAPFDLVLGNVLQTDVTDTFADLRFDPNLLSLDFDNCVIAADIADSHVLEGGAGSGQAQIDVASRADPAVLPAGPLVSCAFDVAPGIMAGTASLTFAGARALDPEGNDLDVITLDGVVILLHGTRVPTPTHTVGPTFTVRSASGPSDCSVVAPTDADVRGSWFLLGGAVFVLILRPWRRARRADRTE